MSYHSRRDGSVALWLPKFCIQIKTAIKKWLYGDEKTRLNSTAYLQTIRRKNIMQLPPICTRTQGPIRLKPWCRIRKIINLASLWHITSLHCNRFWLRLHPCMSGENKKDLDCSQRELISNWYESIRLEEWLILSVAQNLNSPFRLSWWEYASGSWMVCYWIRMALTWKDMIQTTHKNWYRFIIDMLQEMNPNSCSGF